MYRLNLNLAGVVRISDGATIPADENNREWREVLAWMEDGNTPLPDPAENAWRSAVWIDYRTRRETYLDRLAGIAMFDDTDGTVKAAAKQFRQRLLDLPSDPSVQVDVTPDKDALELAIVTLYRAAVNEAATAAPAAKAAFSKVSN